MRNLLGASMSISKAACILELEVTGFLTPRNLLGMMASLLAVELLKRNALATA